MQLMANGNSKLAAPANDLDHMRILVIEDDREAATWLLKGLTESGHVADHAADGEAGLALAREKVHDVLIVDRMLPRLDGLSIIQGLRAGGDDYLAKPYAFSELLARIEGLSRRRHQGPQQTKLKAADLEMDLLTRTVTRSGRPIILQPREFKLLEYLMRNAGHVVTR